MDVTLNIRRQVEGRKWYQDYTVPVTTGMTVLEGLIYVKEHLDPTLSFTSSCRSSICGACAVRVNGNAELACEVLIETLTARYQTEQLTIQPLGNFKVIRDLVVDWEPKAGRIKKIQPALHPKAEFTAETGCKQTPEEFNRYKKYAGCILCGSCVSECSKNTLNQKDFLDPFAFVKAAQLTGDTREKDSKERLKAVLDAGLWSCFNCQECTAKCPKHLDPAGAIEKLKEATFAYGLADNVRSEGLFLSALRLPMALRLMNVGKMNPLDKHPVNPEVKTIAAIVKAAEKES